MSLIITAHTHDGFVMAADSRLTVLDDSGNATYTDTSYKLFRTKGGIGISTAGDANIGPVPLAHYLDSFCNSSVVKDVETTAKELLAYIQKLNPSMDSVFHVAGYDQDRTKRLFIVRIPTAVIDPMDVVETSMSWHGQSDIMIRLLNTGFSADETGNPGQKHPQYDTLLQYLSFDEVVEFVKNLLKITSLTMKYQRRANSVGGPTDILVLTPEGSKWLRRKKRKTAIKKEPADLKRIDFEEPHPWQGQSTA